MMNFSLIFACFSVDLCRFPAAGNFPGGRRYISLSIQQNARFVFVTRPYARAKNRRA